MYAGRSVWVVHTCMYVRNRKKREKKHRKINTRKLILISLISAYVFVKVSSLNFAFNFKRIYVNKLTSIPPKIT